MKKIIAFFLLSLFFCVPESAQAQRIISLEPAITEVLFSLGVSSEIVGNTRYCDYPESAKKIEKVGDYIHPNLEKMLALHPDLVLMSAWSGSPVAQRLKKAGIRVVAFPLPKTVDEVGDRIEQIGAAVNREEIAKEKVTLMRQSLVAIIERAKKRKPRSVYIEVDTGYWTISKASFMSDAVEKTGLRNIFRDLPAAAAQVSSESVIAKNPDVLLIPRSRRAEILSRPGWQTLSAVKNNRVITEIGENTLNRPTLRVIEGMQKLSEALDALDLSQRNEK